MNYFYLICNDGYDANSNDQPVSAFDICMKRLEEKKWPLYRNTQGIQKIKNDSQFLIYLAGKNKYSQQFVASFITDKIIEGFDMHYDNFNQSYLHSVIKEYIQIKEIKIFEQPFSKKTKMNELDFIKNKDKYGIYFQGGLKSISEQEFKKINVK